MLKASEEANRKARIDYKSLVGGTKGVTALINYIKKIGFIHITPLLLEELIRFYCVL
jgi:hypothetical protein